MTDTRLFHTETPITACSFDIRTDYAERYGRDPNTQKQDLVTLGAVSYHGGMNEIDKAHMVAAWFHRNDTDMAKEAYILHCQRTASRVHSWCVANEINQADTATCVAVAFLHDVVEDTPCTFADLQLLGFSTSVVNGVIAMTQRVDFPPEGHELDGVPCYEALEVYWARVKANWHAHVVKVIGDQADNDDPVRMDRGNMPLSRQEKLHAKYALLREFLGTPDPKHAPFGYDRIGG